MSKTEEPTLVMICGSAWGIGTYEVDGELGYGFPWASMNPHDFDPDRECCTTEEIKAWEAAKIAWDKAPR